MDNKMKETPILYSTPMVQAIMNDRKWKTRRIVMPQPSGNTMDDFLDGKWLRKNFGGLLMPRISDLPMECPYGQPGDILWVRETTWISECKRYIAQGLERQHSSKLDIVDLETGKRYIWQLERSDYAPTDGMITSWSWQGRFLRSNRATDDFDVSFADVDTTVKIEPFSGNIILQKYKAQFRKKLPAIFMPRKACRLFLQITDIKVEKLQDITVEDVIAEGIDTDNDILNPDPETHESIKNWNYQYAQFQYKELWDSLNAKRGCWEQNPWVWVISFERYQQEKVI